ncbi:hypothetical protein GGS24DRAFT_485128 [Hypoxylon argillaceum]|nr:hypothetical protein GGS24DRAFT_485128 [Hypoxylon argillaceum]
MTGLSDALQAVEAGQDSPCGPSFDIRSPSPITLSPGRRSLHARRSGSQTNLAKHNVRDETPAKDRFNIPAVQKALRNTKSLMSEMVNVLSSSTVHNEPGSVMARLRRQAEDLAQFECPPTRTVGFVGDSGAGKSSLINSLLDPKDLARSSNSGWACTCVVTEFHFHKDEKFDVRVKAFSEAELIPQLENLLQDYGHFHLNRDSLERLEAPELEERARVAEDTFQAMFRGRLINKDILIQGPESNALSTLKLWLRDFPSGSMLERGKSGLSLVECSNLVMELTSESSEISGTHLWPWIKKIEVYSNAHILSQGLVLADLPGLRDLNSARRNITERYLLECNEIFVVAAAGRVTTDEGVRSAIELAKKAKLSNMGIICTKSDDIEASEALRDWGDNRVAREIREKQGRILQDESDKSALEMELSSYEEIDDNNLSKDELNELNLLNTRLRSIKRRLYQHKFDLQKILVTTRNARIKEELINLYSREVSGNLLRVFCVSNTMYWTYRETPRITAMPRLILSGILEVRAHFIGLVSESQHKAAVEYMRNDIGVLLGELGLWVQSGKGYLNAEKKAEIRNTLDGLENKLYLDLCGGASALNGAVNLFKREFDTMLYRPQSSHFDRWSAAAKAASEDWSCWSHQTYAAFCRHFGTHYTATVEQRNWNEEIIQKMTDDLSPPWEQLQINLDQQSDGIFQSIDNFFSWADQFLDAELDSSRDTAVSIKSTLSSQKRVLRSDIEKILDNLQGDLRTLRTDVFSSIRTSFIGKIMENEYDKARRQSGRGSDARKKAIINSAVQRNGLFTDLLKSFKKEFNEHVDNAQDNIQQATNSHLEAIKNTFNIVRSDNAALESEKDPEFHARVEARLDAANEEMRRVYNLLGA